MEALIGSLIGIVIVQFSLLWYRLGKVEQKLQDLNRKVKGGEPDAGLQKH